MQWDWYLFGYHKDFGSEADQSGDDHISHREMAATPFLNAQRRLCHQGAPREPRRVRARRVLLRLRCALRVLDLRVIRKGPIASAQGGNQATVVAPAMGGPTIFAAAGGAVRGFFTGLLARLLAMARASMVGPGTQNDASARGGGSSKYQRPSVEDTDESE